MSTRRVWVVEMKMEGRSEFVPTVGIALTEDESERVLSEWIRRNPDDLFRITKYEATR